MKLFIVGSDKIYAIENFYVKYLRELGVEVMHFPAQSMFYDHYQKNTLHKLLYKAGVSNILKRINQCFIKEVEKCKPDIIWIFKGMEIFPESLKWAKSKSIKLVNYNGDSPFIFSGKGSGNKNVTDAIPLYDLFLTYNQEDKKKMESKYQVRAEILPFGFDLDDQLFHECCKLKEVKKACFLGNPDSGRSKFLSDLAMKGIKMDVYGNSWNQFVNHKNITVNGPVYNQDFWKTLRKYRIQLNLMRPHNLTSHNMRTFEAAGVGAIELAPETPDHKNFFEENEDIFLYNDVDSCYKQVNKIMDLSDLEAIKVRESVRVKSIGNGYSYKSRSKQSLAFLETLNFK